MKESVIDIDDLGEMLPFFKTRIGRPLGKLVLRLLCIDKVNLAHKRNCHVKGELFTTALLRDPLIDLRYNIHNEELLEHLPEGAFITVSNHPIGSLDGIILIDIFTRRRPDFKVMVNGILTKISAMEESFISVIPDSHKRGANPANINGVRLSLQRLKEGHPMGFFPAGAISFYDKHGHVRDLTWAHSVVRLIRKGNVPVYPVYFDFCNSSFFYWLGRISWQLRTLRIPAEVFNKRGRTVDVYIGEPIPAERVQSFSDDKELAQFLYDCTYNVKK